MMGILALELVAHCQSWKSLGSQSSSVLFVLPESQLRHPQDAGAGPVDVAELTEPHRTRALVSPGLCPGRPAAAAPRGCPGETLQGMPIYRWKTGCMMCELIGRRVGKAVVWACITGRKPVISSFRAKARSGLGSGSGRGLMWGADPRGMGAWGFLEGRALLLSGSVWGFGYF